MEARQRILDTRLRDLTKAVARQGRVGLRVKSTLLKFLSQTHEIHSLLLFVAISSTKICAAHSPAVVCCLHSLYCRYSNNIRTHRATTMTVIKHLIIFVCSRDREKFNLNWMNPLSRIFRIKQTRQARTFENRTLWLSSFIFNIIIYL